MGNAAAADWLAYVFATLTNLRRYQRDPITSGKRDANGGRKNRSEGERGNLYTD